MVIHTTLRAGGLFLSLISRVEKSATLSEIPKAAWEVKSFVSHNTGFELLARVRELFEYPDDGTQVRHKIACLI